MTKVYFTDGTVHQEKRTDRGEFVKTKLDASSAGYVIDNTPDLSICEILPWLYLGSQDVTHDYQLVKSNNISHILSIGVPAPEYEGITSTFVNALDLEEFPIASILPQCIDVINDAKRQLKTVYVHCNAGISRSPTVVAAYLMQHDNLTSDEAVNRIREKRPKVRPNAGFLKQLREWGEKRCENFAR